MGQGNFSQPPEGPQIGPTRQFNELSEEKKRELGDLAEAAKSTVFTPAPLDPRVAAQEQTKEEAKQSVPDTQFDVGTRNPLQEDPRLQEAAEKFAALQSVIDTEADEEEGRVREAAMPTDEDKQVFFRALLGMNRYEKTFELFGGMLRATFVELTPDEEDHIFAELGKAQRNGVINTEEDWSVLFERLRMMHSIRKLTRSGADTYERNPDAEDLDKILYTSVEPFISQFSGSIVYRALMDASRLFRTQLELMVESAASPDFWKVDGQASPQQPASEEPSTTARNHVPDRGTSSKE